jgi:hypothetical protein
MSASSDSCSHQRGNAKLVKGRSLLVLYVEPLLPPTLNRGSHVKFNTMRLGAHRYDSPA